jgi:hypothetical protein
MLSQTNKEGNKKNKLVNSLSSREELTVAWDSPTRLITGLFIMKLAAIVVDGIQIKI